MKIKICILLWFLGLNIINCKENNNLSLVQQQNIIKIANYLNNIKTIEAKFNQYSSLQTLSGYLYLCKPYKLKIEYLQENELLITSDKDNLYFVDKKSANISSMPIMQSPAYFLLNHSINIQKQFLIIDVQENSQYIILTIKDRNNGWNMVKIVFKKNPIQLLQWTIIDFAKQKTIVKINTILVNKEKMHGKDFKIWLSK